MKELIVSDTNVLVDYYKARPELLEILCKIFLVKVPRVIMDEIDQFTDLEAREFGIEIIDTDYLEDNELENTGRLSDEDKACASLVIDLNSSCLTNDKNLKKYVESKGLKTYWGMEMILLLVEKNEISKDDAVKIAEDIFQENAWFSSDIVEGFWSKLKLL